MIDNTADLIEFSDRVIRIRLPAYLTGWNEPKSLTYLFEPESTRLGEFETVNIDLFPHDDPDTEMNVALKRSMLLSNSLTNNKCLRQTKLRAGETSIRRGAVELALASEHKQLHTTEYGWLLLIPFDGGHAYLKIVARGDFFVDEPLWTQVVQSLEVKDWTNSGDEQKPVESVGRFAVDDDVAVAAVPEFDEILNSLPEELQYLRIAIATLARQPPEELETGEADIAQLESAVYHRTSGLAFNEAVELCNEDRRRLEQWLNAAQCRDNPLMTPVGFVLGVLHSAHLLLRNVR
jgi:hypothetical protein